MPLLRRLLASTIHSALWLLLGSVPLLSQEAPVRILPLGDSITYGEISDSLIQGGYRNHLYQLLDGAGFNVDFVGTFSDTDNPTLPDSNHQGMPGWRVDELINGKTTEPASGNIQTWLDSVEDPDVILLLIGTNDIWQNYLYAGQFPLAQTEANLKTLIATIATRRPFTKIILSTLPQRIDEPAIEAAQLAYNANLPDIVAEQVSLGRQVSLVDMHLILTEVSDYGDDGVHPSTQGYGKMAGAWYQAIADPVTGVITPQGTSNPPVIARITAAQDGTHVSLQFSKPVADDAANLGNFSISGALTVSSAVLDATTKRTLTLTTSPQAPGAFYTVSVSGVKDRTPQQNLIAPQSMASFSTDAISNGSFEIGYTGWSATGNLEIQLDGTFGYASSDGSHLVSFNSGNSDPGGSISQTFSTLEGRTYQLAFDYGILANRKNVPQEMLVTVQGTAPLVSESRTLQSSVKPAVKWIPTALTFTADSTSTVVTFTDQSTIQDSIDNDLLLDHVRVELIETPTLAVTSSPSSGVTMTVSQNDLDSNGSGTTGLIRFYNPGTLVTLETPAAVAGSNFLYWRKNGVNLPGSGTSINLMMESRIALDAVYETSTIDQQSDFAQWLSGFGLTATASEDSDEDSIPNAIEYVIGGNPKLPPHTQLLPTLENVNANPAGGPAASDYLLFTYRRTDLAQADPHLSLTVEWSTDPSSPWIDSQDTPGTVIIEDNDPEEEGVDLVHVFLPQALAAEGRLFVRLKAVVSPP